VRELKTILILAIAYLWLLKPIHTIAIFEPGHVDANLEKIPLSGLLPNVSLTRFGECAVVRIHC
jgi:hypothetical protein